MQLDSIVEFSVQAELFKAGYVSKAISFCINSDKTQCNLFDNSNAGRQFATVPLRSGFPQQAQA